MWRQMALGAGAAVLLLAAAGCRRDAPPARAGAETVVDLLATFPATGGGQATEEIDPGEPGAALLLTRGWSLPETGTDGHAVVWTTAPRVEIAFDAGAVPVDLTLVLDCLVTGDLRQPLFVLPRLGGRPIGRLRLDAGAQQQRLALPAARQRPGRNTLELFTPALLIRARAGAAGSTRFGIRGVRFDAVGPRPPAPRITDGRLLMPAGTSTSWFLRVDAGARLTLHAAEPGGLRLSVTPDGGRERSLDAENPDLAPEAGRIVRLTAAATVPVALDRLQLRAPAPAPPAPPGALSPRPNVVLYVTDTVRADHLGCYGYARPTTPAIDAFAGTAVQFDDVVASASWTRPATASILTGRDPADHGATSLLGGIRPDVPTLAELLHTAGYTTGAVVTNLNVAARFGFGRGFDQFRYLEERDDRPATYASADELNAAAFPWLDAQHGHPFFLYLHASDAHAPYRPAPEQAARFLPPGIQPTITPDTPLRSLLAHPGLVTPDNVALLGALYDGDVAAVDAGFGALLAKLDALGVARTTVVILVADHGEEFADHGGLEHGRTLYQELLHVPLIVRLPGGAGGGRRVTTVARQIDLLPTVLALVGTTAPAGLAGRPLLSATGEPLAGVGDAVFGTELSARHLVGLRSGTWKAVFDDSRLAATELYDLATDPREQHDLAAARPILAGYARQGLAERELAARGHPGHRVDTTIADPETERRLRALGYVDDGE